MKRPNFYRVLDLDPAVEEVEDLRRRLEEKQSQWSRDTTMGNASARQRARQCLEWVPEMKRVLFDPEVRAQEAEAARQETAAQRQARERELEERIATVRASGSCDRVRLDRLARDFAAVFPRHEIEHRLVAAGVNLEAPGATADPEPLDPSVARDLRRGLSHLGLGSVYEVLDKPPEAPRENLLEAARELYRRTTESGKTDLDTTVRKNLAGHAQVLFASDAARARYDHHLALAPMEALEPEIRLAVAGGEISVAARERLLRRAAEKGVDAAIAGRYLEAWGKRQGVRVAGTDSVRYRVSEESPVLVSQPPALPAPQRQMASMEVADSAPPPAQTPPPLPKSSPETASKRRKRAVMWVPALCLGGLASWLAVNPPPRYTPPVRTTPPPVSSPTPGPTPTPAPGSAVTPPVPSPSPSTPPTVRRPSAPKSSPTPPPSPRRRLREVPRVAVLVAGEAAVTGPVREELTDRLARDGLDVVTSPTVGDLVRRHGDPLVSDLLVDLRPEEIDVLVHARVVWVGERELQYFGRQDRQTVSRLEVEAYLVREGTGIGPGWSQPLEYTALNAGDQARRSAAGMAPDLAAAVQEGWRSHRGP